MNASSPQKMHFFENSCLNWSLKWCLLLSGHPKIEISVLLGLEQVCQVCAVSFSFCEHCWRGHKYCGPFCSLEGRKRNRRAAEQKYAATTKGQESRRRRQKNFRNRNILGLKVTDHSPRDTFKIIKRILSATSKTSKQCRHCQKHIHAVVPGDHFEISEKNNNFSFTRFRSRNDDLPFWVADFYKSPRTSLCPGFWKLGAKRWRADISGGCSRYLVWPGERIFVGAIKRIESSESLATNYSPYSLAESEN